MHFSRLFFIFSFLDPELPGGKMIADSNPKPEISDPSWVIDEDVLIAFGKKKPSSGPQLRVRAGRPETLDQYR